MSFSATLANSLSGLSAASLRAEILSFNIANANTDNYARRQVTLEPVVPGGVRASGIERLNGGPLEERLVKAEARSAGEGVKAEALAAINKAYGEPGDPDGLFAVFVRFEEALADLRLTPESGAAQLGLLRAATDLAETFARLDTEAQAMRLEADGAIAATVDRLNDALQELDRLNDEARRPRGASLDNVAERQRALVREIGGALDVSVAGTYGGQVQLRTGGGLLLLGEEPQALQFTPAGTASFNLSYAAGDFSGLLIGNQDVTPGNLQGLRGGSLEAQFAIRDSLAPAFAARLDALATELSERSALADPTSPDGLFVLAAGAASAAQRIAVNPQVDPDQGGALYRLRDGVGAAVPGPAAGDGVLGALNDALLATRPLSVATGAPNPLNFKDTLGAVASQLATETLRARGASETAQTALGSLTGEIARITAVDTDQELQDLLLVEQAFAANARVIQAADDMLAQLLEI